MTTHLNTPLAHQPLYLPSCILSFLSFNILYNISEACNELLFLEAIAIKDLVGKYGYPYAADDSPFMVDSFQVRWFWPFFFLFFLFFPFWFSLTKLSFFFFLFLGLLVRRTE